MLTFICLIIFNAWPYQLGIPWWALALSMFLDLVMLFVTSNKGNSNVHI